MTRKRSKSQDPLLQCREHRIGDLIAHCAGIRNIHGCSVVSEQEVGLTSWQEAQDEGPPTSVALAEHSRSSLCWRMFAEAWNRIWRLQRPVLLKPLLVYYSYLECILSGRRTVAAYATEGQARNPKQTQAFELLPSPGHSEAEADEIADYLRGTNIIIISVGCSRV